MVLNSEAKQIIVAPQVFVSLEPEFKTGGALSETGPNRIDIGVAWSWDETNFRMDVTLPQAGALNIMLPLKVDTVYVNGVIVWDKEGLHKTGIGTTTVAPAESGLLLNFAAGGSYHILAHGLTEDGDEQS